MTELLLRGAQSVGELRAHVSRMEPIADLPALHALLDGLVTKKLVVWLTPEGRGQVVAHALYQAQELQRLRAEHSGRAAATDMEGADRQPTSPRPSTAVPLAAAPLASSSSPSRAAPIATPSADLAGLRQELGSELAEAKAQIAQLRDELRSLRESFGREIAELQRFRQEVGG